MLTQKAIAMHEFELKTLHEDKLKALENQYSVAMKEQDRKLNALRERCGLRKEFQS